VFAEQAASSTSAALATRARMCKAG
jgi:hypothetical protein